MNEPEIILATDCGSTTTKAILIEKRGDEYRLAVRGEAPTTVEAPFEDVTVGVLNAVAEVEELSGRKLVEGRGIRRRARTGQQDAGGPTAHGDGTDLYLSTSSAGGGLQIVVVGLVRRMTAESAERAALGAGAIVMDVLALDDGRLPHERIERLRQLRPDMVLISGGVDGGEQRRVVEMAEIVAAANPEARLGAKYKLPVIYAGNMDNREAIEKILGPVTALSQVDNLRPTPERENLPPTRGEIQDLFLHHVMAQAPGYANLVPWTDADIMPTPAAVGNIMQTIAEAEGINIVGVDIGGATTDVFSVFGGRFNRTVSANLGMSYSISNVLAEAGAANIMRWLTAEHDPEALGQSIRNKMIRPTTIPQQMEGLKVEQAVAREALRLAFDQHRLLATGLKGVQRERDISEAFSTEVTGETFINMMDLDLLVGSGGVLSHTPRRAQAAMMMVDAFLPEGLTRLAVDSIFMMPQLGVLANVLPEAARQVFEKDCLIHLGLCVAPVGQGKPGAECLKLTLDAGEHSGQLTVPCGGMGLLPLPEGVQGMLTIEAVRGFDLGQGRGRSATVPVTGGVVGIIGDARGRPVVWPKEADRAATVRRWQQALGAYPE
ncbi:glutamate mutase L [bacterium]|nr:glutamate mutase L [bacterium]